MEKTPLTKNQEAVYNFLVQKMQNGIPPTVREICSATGIKSTSTVHAILNALEEHGYILRDAKYSRAIKLENNFDASMVPLVGRVTAGQPILAVEQIEDYIPYLFPISSMTEEQKVDMIKSSCGIGSDKNVFDWFNKNHFDYRGLIPKGLAINATGLNIY